MSSLNWVETPHSSYKQPTVITLYWELWAAGEDQQAWYNLPKAQIRKVDKVWELVLSGSNEVRHYRTLKEAKAMGIALVRMDDAV
jgi:hypothetical protein